MTTYSKNHHSDQGGDELSCNDSDTTIDQLISQVRLFLKEREWEKYQNPKDLAESICIEAAELRSFPMG
jgi:hypothetical protein